MGEGATVPVKRGRAYQELLASNSECRRPLRLPREGRRERQAGGERRPDGAEAGRRHPASRPPSAVHGGRASAGGRSSLTTLTCPSRVASTPPPGDRAIGVTFRDKWRGFFSAMWRPPSRNRRVPAGGPPLLRAPKLPRKGAPFFCRAQRRLVTGPPPRAPRLPPPPPP